MQRTQQQTVGAVRIPPAESGRAQVLSAQSQSLLSTRDCAPTMRRPVVVECRGVSCECPDCEADREEVRAAHFAGVDYALETRGEG